MEMSYRILLAVYGIVNLIVFVMYGVDKLKAKHEKWRTPEKTLIIAAVFGVIGGLLGMLVFHHKTRKPKFSVGLPLIFVCEAVGAVLIYFKVMLPKM